MTLADRYPKRSGRRRFVKGIVGSAALSGIGAATAAGAEMTTASTGEGGGRTRYVGIENVRGPAPRAMPMIPVRIDDEGYLKGLWPEPRTETRDGKGVTVAETELGGTTYSSRWFQYCGMQGAPGIQPGAERDDYFRYTGGTYGWQAKEVSPGDRMHVEDFADYETWGNGIGRAELGKPAMGTWRSEDAPDADTIPVQVLRIPPDVFGQMREAAGGTVREWLDAASREGFVAWLDKCTHFCCVPTFKASPRSANFGGEDGVYCSCHQSVYDPFSPVVRSFVALPRPG